MPSRKPKIPLLLCFVAFLSLAASSASALVLTSSDSVVARNFSWSYTTPSSTTLSGTGSVLWSGFQFDRLRLQFSLSNTASIGGQGGERLTAFGFAIDPDVTFVAFSDADDQGMIGASAVSNGSIKNIEICAFGGNNCNGGANGGIYGGSSDTFTLLLSGLSPSLTSVTINPFGYKYQTGYGSFEFNCTDSNCGGGRVPEPATPALLGAAVIGAALIHRRRRAARAPVARVA